MVWFHDIGVHVNSALIFISIFTEPAHSLFDITFQYTTFLERTCLACLISILNGSVFWFHGIGIHVNLALLLSALRWAHKIGLRIKSEKLYRSGEVELFSFFEGLSFVSWYFDWFSILISLNWRAHMFIWPGPAHSISSRAAACHFWVLYPLRLRRHISQAFRLDVLWLLARQTPWGLLGWFLDVTSSGYWKPYILVLFNKRSFRRQIDNLSRCIFWDFGVMLFIHVY